MTLTPAAEAPSSPPQTVGRRLAEMELGVPPEAAKALVEQIHNGRLGYFSDADQQLVQRATQGWLREMYGWDVACEQVRPVANVVTGFRAVLNHFVPSAAPILVPTPAYMPFIALPPTVGHEVIEAPMIREHTGPGEGEWRYDFDALRAGFERGARLLVLCNPHNPIGKSASREEMAQLEALVAEYDALVFSDEIHAPLTLSHTRHTVYASTSARAAAHTITAVSASKAFNMPGTKCGQLVFSDPGLLERWQRFGHWVEHEASPLGATATDAAYTHSRDWLADTKATIERNLSAAIAELVAHADTTGIRFIRPEATYLLWLDLSGCAVAGTGVDAAHPASALLETHAGVITTDGAACGEAGVGHCRLNGALREENLMEAVRRINACVRARS